jgi:hypothetical protein
VVAGTAGESRPGHRVPGLPGGGDTEPAGAFRVVAASGVRGVPDSADDGALIVSGPVTGAG